MSSKPHSQKVRGTFDNPKTKAAITSGTPPPRLGDPTSLKPENDDNIALPSNDSAPPGTQGNINRQGDGRHNNGKGDLPHSKTVRGTLANTEGKKASRMQLGDPTSLKAETSNTQMGRGVEREGMEKSKL